MSKLRRVFFLTYHFPPLAGAGALRAAKLAKYLPEFGWQPTVFHAGAGSTYDKDPALAAELAASIRSVPVRTFEMAGLTRALGAVGLNAVTYRIHRAYPIDPQIGWLPFLAAAVKREIARSGPPDAIFTSSAPNSVHLAGLDLRRRQGTAWVADFRDEWSQNPGARFATPLHRRLAVRFEKATLENADAVTTVTPMLVAQFGALRPAGLRSVELIRNGFDPDDFNRPILAPPGDKWTLGIVGTAYDATDPRVVLEVLAEVTGAGRIDPAKVRVVHAGRGSVNWPAQAKFERRQTGLVTHSQAIDSMLRSDALLLTIQRPAAAGTRIYEYLRSGRPVVAVVPHGEASVLVESTGAGRSFTPAERDGLREHLVALYDAWSAKRPVSGAASERVEPYSRRHQARQLAEIFDAVAR